MPRIPRNVPPSIICPFPVHIGRMTNQPTIRIEQRTIANIPSSILPYKHIFIEICFRSTVRAMRYTKMKTAFFGMSFPSQDRNTHVGRPFHFGSMNINRFINFQIPYLINDEVFFTHMVFSRELTQIY